MEEILSTRFHGTFFHCDTAWREMLSSFAMTTSRFRSRISAIVGSTFFLLEGRGRPRRGFLSGPRPRRRIAGTEIGLSVSDIGETSHRFLKARFH